jgi:hypothetical protein
MGHRWYDIALILHLLGLVPVHVLPSRASWGLGSACLCTVSPALVQCSPARTEFIYVAFLSFLSLWETS